VGHPSFVVGTGLNAVFSTGWLNDGENCRSRGFAPVGMTTSFNVEDFARQLYL
jgi:hypothetical protein